MPGSNTEAIPRGELQIHWHIGVKQDPIRSSRLALVITVLIDSSILTIRYSKKIPKKYTATIVNNHRLPLT
jgi:hypothetical protein